MSLSSAGEKHAVLKDAAAVLFLAGAAFLFFAGAFWPQDGRLLFGYDVFRMFYPFGQFTAEAFRAGELPLWNPTVFLGFPQYAEPQLSTFYPPAWTVALLPATVYFPLQYALHFAWTAVGGYILVRRLGGRCSGALLTGFTLTFALTMTVRPFVGHLPHVMTLAWVPWALAAAHWAVGRRTLTAALIAGFPLGMAFLVGYIPYLILLVPGVSLFMVWLALSAWREGDQRGAWFILGQLAVIGVVAALLAAVQLLPAAEFAQRSNRTSGRYDYRDNQAVAPAYLLTALMPDLFGALQGPVGLWVEHLSIDFYSEWALYTGIVPLLLLALAWVVIRRRDRFWILLALLGVLLAVGDSAGLNRVLYDFVPGMNAFRFVSRPIYFFTLGTTVAAGLAFDRWFDLPRERHTELAAGLRKLLWMVVGLGIALLVIAALYHLLLNSAERGHVTAGFVRQVLRAVVFAVAALGLLIWGFGRPRLLVLAAALLLLGLDLWGQGLKFLTYVSGEPYPEWATVDELLPDGREDYRVLTKVLAENGGYFFGLNSIYGYDGFTLEAAETMHDLAVADARIVRLLSGRFLVHGPGWDLPVVAPGWEVYAEPEEMTVFSRNNSGPRAFLVHEVLGAVDQADALRIMQQPELDFTRTAVVQMLPDTSCALEPGDPAADSVTITVQEPGRVALSVEAGAAGWLVLNDQDYPGWQATIDDQPAVIQTTNYALRGVCVPPGTHEVVFTFRPALLTYGLMISVGALLLVLGAMFALIVQARSTRARSPDHPHIPR